MNIKPKNEIDEIKTAAIILLSKGFIEDKQYNQSYILNTINELSIDLPKVEKGDSLASTILLIKVPSYGVKIIPPDWLIYLIDICADGNPGFLQLIYKELLSFINNACYAGTGIPENYKIRAIDFANCFSTDYPIIKDPKIYAKYSKLWDEQKRKTTKNFEPDNLCDIAEYWLEVMEK